MGAIQNVTKQVENHTQTGTVDAMKCSGWTRYYGRAIAQMKLEILVASTWLGIRFA